MQTPQSTSVWAALAVAQAVAGGITWIDPSNFQPNVDALNLYWDSTNQRMSVQTAGDYAGTDAINAGAQVDSYKPMGFVIGTVGSPPGFSVSTSRGSRLAPLISLTADEVGSFGFYALLQNGALADPAYAEIASIRANLTGTDPLYPGARMRFAIKNDNGALTEYLVLRTNAAGVPIFANASVLTPVALGIGGNGFKQLAIDGTHAGATGNIQIDKAAGSVLFAAAGQTLTLTNALIGASSIVMCTVATDDVTAKSAVAVVAGAGSCTIKLNAAATAQTKVFFWLVVL